MSIPAVPVSSSSIPNSAMIDSLGTDPAGTLMQVMLTGWLAGLDEIQAANAEALKSQQKSGTDNIQDAANVASSYPMLAMPQVVLNPVTPTSTENASRAQGQDGSAVAGVSSDTAKQSTAMYAYLMAHTLGQMSGKTIGSNTLNSWMTLEPQKAVSLLAFMAAANTQNKPVDDGADDGNAAAIAKFKQKELDAELNFTHNWLKSVEKLGDDLKQLDKDKALKAMQAYTSEAKENPALLDASHVQTIVAVTVLSLLVSAGPSPITARTDSTPISQVSMIEASSMNPTMGQMDTTAAIAMIAALMAQVAQAQVVLLQVKEKPALDAKKVSETFATDNANKMMGFVEDKGYQVFLKNLVENMAGKQNLERNIALVKINMLMTALWLVARAETDGVKFSTIMDELRSFLSPKDAEKATVSSQGSPRLNKVREQLLGKVKELVDAFGKEGAADLMNGLERMMNFMEGKGQSGDLADVTDPKKLAAFLLPDESKDISPPPASI